MSEESSKFLLQDFELDQSVEEQTRSSAKPVSAAQTLAAWRWVLLGHGILLIFNLCILILHVPSLHPSDKACATQLSSYSPALPYLDYETVRFKSFTSESKFKGKPSPELNKAWEDLIVAGYVSIPKDEFVRELHKNLTYVSLPESQGDVFIGNLEAYHQLHCLNLIRQYTYEDDYRQADELPTAFQDSDKVLRDHVDHCIDYLREFIMCVGDASIHTYYWVEGRDFPWPDFEVERKCRRWQSFSEYANAVGRDLQLPTKPRDAVEYPNPMKASHHHA